MEKELMKCKNASCENKQLKLSQTFGFCDSCEKKRASEYDNFVDPTGFYQNKSIENYD
jgi:hypothetical protein